LVPLAAALLHSTHADQTPTRKRRIKGHDNVVAADDVASFKKEQFKTTVDEYNWVTSNLKAAKSSKANTKSSKASTKSSKASTKSSKASTKSSKASTKSSKASTKSSKAQTTSSQSSKTAVGAKLRKKEMDPKKSVPTSKNLEKTKMGEEIYYSLLSELQLEFEFDSMSMTTTPTSSPTFAPSRIPSEAPSRIPSEAPFLTPTQICNALPRAVSMRNALVEVTAESLLTNPSTPQGMAYLWLLDDDPLQVNPCSYETLLQRYALATFSFSTTESSPWVEANGWLSGQFECDWFGVTCAGGDLVTQISLGKYHGWMDGWNCVLEQNYRLANHHCL
jgi:hypothetical protein